MNMLEIFARVVMCMILLLIIIGVGFSMVASNICKDECIDRGTRFHELLPDGRWFSIEDMCVCHFNDGTEYKFIIGRTSE